MPMHFRDAKWVPSEHLVQFLHVVSAAPWQGVSTKVRPSSQGEHAAHTVSATLEHGRRVNSKPPMQVVQFLQTVFASAVQGASSVFPSGHAKQASHTLSDAGVGDTLSNSLSAQTVWFVHTRSDVAVGGCVSNWLSRQAVCCAQVRSDVRVGAAVWNSPALHCVAVAQTRSDDPVDATCSYSSGEHTVYAWQTPVAEFTKPAHGEGEGEGEGEGGVVDDGSTELVDASAVDEEDVLLGGVLTIDADGAGDADVAGTSVEEAAALIVDLGAVLGEMGPEEEVGAEVDADKGRPVEGVMVSDDPALGDGDAELLSTSRDADIVGEVVGCGDCNDGSLGDVLGDAVKVEDADDCAEDVVAGEV